MALTVASVAYPLAPVGPDAAGGAEQVLASIDRHLVERGDRSIVVACAGSRVAGALVETPAPPRRITNGTRAAAAAAVRAALGRVLARHSVDLVHLHGHDFDAYLPPADVTALATIHLPPELLTARLDRIERQLLWTHGVSVSQHRRLPRIGCVLPPIENGVSIARLTRRVARRGFALALGRICPEKGFHLAADAARRARTPLLIAGRVFPYAAHRRYFACELRPRLGRDCRFVGAASFARKQRLLAAARCLLVASQVPETSSLVAMEALACGTPVIAFATGALPDIVTHGVTGFIVHDVDEMADAIGRVDRLDRDLCRAHARARFSEDRMLQQYVERYHQILAWAARSQTPACTSNV